MKNIKLISLMFILALITSCEDVMNKKNLESLVADDIWTDPTLVKGFMDNVMKDYLPALPVGTTKVRFYLQPLTDEAYGLYTVSVPYDNIPISISSDTNNGPAAIDRWHYDGIRNINKFFDHVDLCEPLSASDRNDYVAQMLTLRAWLYFDMVRIYGGVPWLAHEQSLEDDLYVTRAKTSECITNIIKDLDDAIAFGSDFPMQRNEENAGRFNKAIALALKGRILLYYASPQFSKETPSGTKSAETRWQEAYTANQTAISELTAAGYGLFRPHPADAAEAIKNYYEMYDEVNEAPNNPEMIWTRRYQWPALTSDVSEWATDGRPTLEFIQAYSNADGTPYNGMTIPTGTTGGLLATPTDAYWIGREPRFYASIAYNGCKWSRYVTGGEVSGDVDATGKIIHFWDFVGAQAPYGDISRTDLHSGKFRKMSDDNINLNSAEGNRSGRDLPLLRYAEVLLNFAECAAKTNHEAEAIQVLKDIRKRAGIPEGSSNYGLGTPSGDALILAIIKERQIELADEDFRFWDVRRWRLYTDVINGYTLKGLCRHGFRPKAKVPITHELLKGMDIDNDPNSYFDVFDNELYALDTQGFSFSERQYFYRLPYEQRIKKNPKLEQTMLWDNGTFNPYE